MENKYPKWLVTILFVVTVDCIYADPGWWSPEIKKEVCDAEEYAENRIRCFGEFYDQQIYKMKAYLESRLLSVDETQCKRNVLLNEFRGMINAKYGFSNSYCALTNHCVGHCGSGHDAGIGCIAGMKSELYEILADFTFEGLNIWGCSIKGTKRPNTLITKRYTITLIG